MRGPIPTIPVLWRTTGDGEAAPWAITILLLTSWLSLGAGWGVELTELPLCKQHLGLKTYYTLHSKPLHKIKYNNLVTYQRQRPLVLPQGPEGTFWAVSCGLFYRHWSPLRWKKMPTRWLNWSHDISCSTWHNTKTWPQGSGNKLQN